jgi:hypothetical protein
MLDLDSARVQRDAAGLREWEPASVETVTDDRAAAGGELRSKLVAAAGHRLEFH